HRQTADRTSVATEGVDQLQGGRVPNLHGAILRGRGDPSAIGAEGHRQALAAELSANSANRLAGIRIPKRELVIPTYGDQAPPVRMEGHAPNRGARSLEGLERRGRMH